jgi:glycosyltransferase involved in cell wall biosynthesis
LIYTLNYGTFFGNILSYLNIYFIKKFDSVISVSNSVNYYSRRYGIRSKVIHNSIDFNFVNNKLNISSKIDLRNKLNLENKVTFISISSRLYGKNIDFLTESFKNNYFDNYILLIAGHVKKSLKIKYFNNTNIIFLDNINNVEEYIKASDYFISASLHEGFPNAVLESMALGTPVILSNIKSHLEFFTDNRLLIGDYFINNNINDLKFKINKITNYNYEYLSNNCIININNNFNSKVITKEYELFYKKINNDLSRFTKL